MDEFDYKESGALEIIQIPRTIKLDQSFIAQLTYLRSSERIRIAGGEIPLLIKNGELVSVPQIIKELDFSPTLSIDGFEHQHIPEGIQSILQQYAKAPNVETERQLRETLRSNLENLLMGKFADYYCVAVDAVYRNTGADRGFGSVPLVHIDFPGEGRVVSDTLETFKEQWGARVKKAGYPYDVKNIEFMVNVWMPIGTVVADPLLMQAVGDRDKTQGRRHPYSAVRRDNAEFDAMGLTPPDMDGDPWYYVPGMEGSCWLFLSSKTPHTAATLSHQDQSPYPSRESFEVRVAVLPKEGLENKPRQNNKLHKR